MRLVDIFKSQTSNCRVLQNVAVCYSCCSVLQLVGAVWCSVYILKRQMTTECTASLLTDYRPEFCECLPVLQCVAMCCSVQQCVAVYYCGLQWVVVCCSVVDCVK